MKINIPVQETIKKRNSVRLYEEKKLSDQDKEKLMVYADSLTNPFGVKVNFHIYETHKANAKPEEKLIKKVDIGIGLSHFHQTTLENGLSGKFEKVSQDNIDVPENINYIISWIPEKANKNK